MKNKLTVSAQSILRLSATSLGGLLLGTVLISSGPALAQAPVADSATIEAKAHALLAKLTLDEKIELLGGVDSMFTQAVPSIGLPRFKMSDGPLGVRTWGPTTAYAGGAALAATWDTALARRVGEGLGRDARAIRVWSELHNLQLFKASGYFEGRIRHNNSGKL